MCCSILSFVFETFKGNLFSKNIFLNKKYLGNPVPGAVVVVNRGKSVKTTNQVSFYTLCPTKLLFKSSLYVETGIIICRDGHHYM